MIVLNANIGNIAEVAPRLLHKLGYQEEVICSETVINDVPHIEMMIVPMQDSDIHLIEQKLLVSLHKWYSL